MKFTALLFSLTILASCSNEEGMAKESISGDVLNSVSELNVVESEKPDGHSVQVAEIEPNYISTDELQALFDQNTLPVILDVRSVASYEQNHITTAQSLPYGTYTDQDLENIEGISLSREIVTYCGCPRHLSTLMANDLENKGYTNVRVLYEGYWHWKDNNHPIVENTASSSSITELFFEGKVDGLEGEVAHVDIFLEHAKTGQLEAVRTDETGQFKVQFHLYDYAENDLFTVTVATVDGVPELELMASPDRVNQVRLSRI